MELDKMDEVELGLLNEKGLLSLLQEIEKVVNQLELPRKACSYRIESEMQIAVGGLSVPERCAFLALIESEEADQEASDCLRALGEYFGLSNFFLDLRTAITEVLASNSKSYRCHDMHVRLLMEKMAASEIPADNMSLLLFMRVMKEYADESRYL